MRCTLVLIEPKVLHHNENVTIDIAKNWQIPAYKYITLLTKNIFVYISMFKCTHKIKLCSFRNWFQSFVTLVSRIMYYLMFLVSPKSSLIFIFVTKIHLIIYQCKIKLCLSRTRFQNSCSLKSSCTPYSVKICIHQHVKKHKICYFQKYL